MHPNFTLIGTRAGGAFVLTRDEWLEAIEKRKVLDVQSEIKDAVTFEQVMVATTEAKWRISYLGQTGEKMFLDDTIPPGSAVISYKIQAVRSTKAGAAAEHIVNFGGSPMSHPIGEIPGLMKAA